MPRYTKCANGCNRFVTTEERICELCKQRERQFAQRTRKPPAKKLTGCETETFKAKQKQQRASIGRLPWILEGGIHMLQCKQGYSIRIRDAAPEWVFRQEAHWAIEKDGQTHACNCKVIESVAAAKLWAVRRMKKILGLVPRSRFEYIVPSRRK